MTTLYRLYDADNRLLYVGIAGNPGRRFEQHRGDNVLGNSQRNGPASTRASDYANARSDRLSLAAREDLEPDSLVGSYFLGDAEHSWQGCVVAEIAPQTYLVELFSWLHGCPTEQRIVTLDAITDWTFYDDPEWLDNAVPAARARWEDGRKNAL